MVTSQSFTAVGFLQSSKYSFKTIGLKLHLPSPFIVHTAISPICTVQCCRTTPIRSFINGHLLVHFNDHKVTLTGIQEVITLK